MKESHVTAIHHMIGYVEIMNGVVIDNLEICSVMGYINNVFLLLRIRE